MKQRITLIASVALLIALVAIPAAAQSYPNPGQGSTITELANKTADSAQVNITYYDQAGVPLAGPSPTIPGNGSVQITSAGSQLPAGYNGAAVVSSNKPLASIVNTRWDNGDGGDGFSSAMYSGVSAGSSKICFASLFKAPPSQYSSFTVQNTGTGTANISIKYYKRDGTAEGTFNDTIPTGAQHTYDLKTPSATVPNLPSGWDGSAIVEVTNGQTVAGVGNVYQVGRTSDYNAADCSSGTGNTTLVIPSQYRAANPGPSWLIWSAINVQNLENQPANIQVQYIPRDSTVNSPLTINYTIPALSAAGFNTRNGGSVAATTFDPMGFSWDGTAKITSNRAIVATINTQWQRGTGIDAGFYSGFNSATAFTKYYLPAVKRLQSGGNWVEFSALLIQNIGTGPANVTTKFYDRNGVVKHTVTETIAAGAGVGYNTRSGTGGTSALGQYEGHAVIESTNGQPIAVVLNGILLSPGAASNTANGIPE